MKILAIATVLLSTAPVLAFNASPKADEPVLAVFDRSVDADRIVEQGRRLGLDVITYKPEFGHLIVQDHDGRSSDTLYDMGARLVIDADLFSTCIPQQTQN